MPEAPRPSFLQSCNPSILQFMNEASGFDLEAGECVRGDDLNRNSQTERFTQTG